jgi:hypothetical protein
MHLKDTEYEIQLRNTTGNSFFLFRETTGNKEPNDELKVGFHHVLFIWGFGVHSTTPLRS